MRFIFHLLGIIYFAIWIAIGAALLIGIFALVKAQPWQMMGNLGNFNGVGSLMGAFGSAGNVADVIQKIQSNKGDIVAAFGSLPKSQQDCLRKELGNKLVDDALAGKTIDPTPDLVLKAMKCVR